MAEKWTGGEWSYRIYATDDDPDELRRMGIEPVRALSNTGQIALVAGDTHIAMFTCQSDYTRGEGHKAECEERDANVRLAHAAPAMYRHLDETTDLLQRLLDDEQVDDCARGEIAVQIEYNRAALAHAALARARGES